MTTETTTTCPGCQLELPHDATAVYTGYFNTVPECWLLFTQVLGVEYSNVVAFAHAHQLTVDTYAVQHAGGPHPDKSMDVHLCGLHCILDLELPPAMTPRIRQQLAQSVQEWPHYPPPKDQGSLTVQDVVNADSIQAHIDKVKNWAVAVWDRWSDHHSRIADLVRHHVKLR
jgi:hypothetical protein